MCLPVFFAFKYPSFNEARGSFVRRYTEMCKNGFSKESWRVSQRRNHMNDTYAFGESQTAHQSAGISGKRLFEKLSWTFPFFQWCFE